MSAKLIDITISDFFMYFFIMRFLHFVFFEWKMEVNKN